MSEIEHDESEQVSPYPLISEANRKLKEQEQIKEEQEQIKQRRSKLNELRENGGIAFPTDFRRNVVAGELLAEYGEKSKEELEAEPLRVKLAGRMMTRRVMGKASFCHIQDMSGKIQLYVTRDALPESFYNEQFKKMGHRRHRRRGRRVV